MANESKTQAEPGSELADLAALLGTVNRISYRLQRAAATLDAGLSVTDWLLLRSLSDEGRMEMAAAARKIGVTRQRVHQQTKPLAAAELIRLDEDKAIALTEKGAAAMKALEESFEQTLSAGGAMPTAPLNGAKLATRRILKAIAPKKAEAGDQ